MIEEQCFTCGEAVFVPRAVSVRPLCDDCREAYNAAGDEYE